MKPVLLDLFCGAGGAAVGYARAGFNVVGVDIRPQPRYPFKFIQDDAIKFAAEHASEYDAIHASPPCQGYSVIRFSSENYPRLIAEVREILASTGKPYAIENVEGAKREMLNYVTLCGSMFGLRVRRHRLFECNPVLLFSPASCNHSLRVVKKGRAPDPEKHLAAIYGHFSNQEYAREAMGIDWMNRDELGESIPPSYTEFVGAHLLRAVSVQQTLAAELPLSASQADL